MPKLNMTASSGFVDVEGSRIHYHLDGKVGAPVLVLSNSLGTNLTLWEPQIPSLSSRMRVLRYDGRGHGKSPASPGEYTIDLLTNDLVAVLDHLDIEKASFCGLSLGGMIGQQLAINAGNRVHKLALCSTAAKIGSAETWNARMEFVRSGGMRAVTESILERWFTPAFANREPAAVERTRQMLLSTLPDGYVANSAAVRDADFRDALKNVHTQTLVISGAHDRSTPPIDGQFLAKQISGAKYIELDAAHISNIEAANEFTDAILTFFTS